MTFFQSVNARRALFHHLITKLEPEDENKFAKFLNKSFSLLRQWVQHQFGDGRKPKEDSYFSTFEHIISFIAGVVHYCPQVLYHQLNSSKAMHRLAVVELINTLTE